MELLLGSDSDDRTKFPIKAIPTLRALAANINPIPIPDTVPALPTKKHAVAVDNAPSAAGGSRPDGQ